MTDSTIELSRLLRHIAERIIAQADELTALDQAIGDGDHGINMKRGMEAVLAELDTITAKPSLSDALKAVGMQLVMKVGGASGPLYGTLVMGLGKALAGKTLNGLDRATLAAAVHDAIAEVQQRGKSAAGQKTLLDVWIPVGEALAGGADSSALRQCAIDAVAATIPMQAIRGRASFLGERSIGHVDPGARSSEIMIGAVCDIVENKL